MNLPAAIPAISPGLYLNVNKCWAKVGYYQCKRPPVNDIGLCDDHLEEFRELGEP